MMINEENLATIRKYVPKMLPVIQAVKSDPFFDAVYLHTSLDALGFSLKPDYPFTKEIPFVLTMKGNYCAYLHGVMLKSGTILDVLEVVKAALQKAKEENGNNQ